MELLRLIQECYEHGMNEKEILDALSYVIYHMDKDSIRIITESMEGYIAKNHYN
jgi:hypothetical protein